MKGAYRPSQLAYALSRPISTPIVTRNVKAGKCTVAINVRR
jgi:hypothetical protein